MTTALAFAAVTTVLKDLLNNGLIDHDLAAEVGDVKVTALAPDRIDTGTTETSQLNLFLYHVTRNPGWANRGLASRDGQGRPVANPPLALDLHYLLSAYGAEEIHAEILLGYGMQLLHENPVLPRGGIRTTLRPPQAVPGGSDLPAALRALVAAGLADQAELVKISPSPLSSDELWQLWSVFDAPYRPTAAYLASLVLIESTRSTRAALPVRARHLAVMPFRHPSVDRVEAQAGEFAPILAETPVVLHGSQLQSPTTRVNVGGVELDPLAVTDTSVTVRLPVGLRAGVQGVQVVQPVVLPTGPHQGVESNAAAFVLRPQVTASVSGVTLSSPGGVTVHDADVAIDVVPPVGRAQRVVLLLNEASGGRGYSFPVAPRPPEDPEEAASLSVRVTGVRPGDYLVRVHVDGAESILTADADGRYVGPVATV